MENNKLIKGDNMGNQKVLNPSIEECIQKICDLCGESNLVSNVVLEFDDTKYNLFLKQKELLIKSICNKTKANLQIPDFEQFYKLLPDADFWKSIKQIVERRANVFINAISYNKLNQEERISLLKKCFELVFIERENSDFIIEQFDDENIGKTLYGVMLESEYAIITLYVSKRRFITGVEESHGLVAYDAEYIWETFKANYDVVARHEFHKRMLNLNRKIDAITNTVDEMQEGFETLLSMSAKDDD